MHVDKLELETPHVKSSQKKPPKKSKCKHEYIKPYTMSKIRFPDGRITEKEYKFQLRARCINCGHQRQGRNKEFIEVFVSKVEYRKLQKEGWK